MRALRFFVARINLSLADFHLLFVSLKEYRLYFSLLQRKPGRRASGMVQKMKNGWMRRYADD